MIGEYICIISTIFYIYWSLFYCLAYSLSWGMFHECLRRIFILLLLVGTLSRCQLSQLVNDSIVPVFYLIADFFFCLLVVSIIENRIFKCPTIIVGLFIYLFNFVCFFPHHFGNFLLGAYTFLVVIVSWWIIPFIIIKCFNLLNISTRCHISLHPTTTLKQVYIISWPNEKLMT